jgi:8-oxo-dGTP pyrophosphatase MutT (NUDIX family)
MSRVSRQLRSRRDYILFQAVSEWPIILSAAGVVLGAAAILPTAVAIVLSVIAVGIGLGALVRDLRQLRRRWSDYEFSAIAAPFPVNAIPPPASYPDPVYLHVPGRGTALVSDVIDRTVSSQDLVAEVDEEPYRLPKTLRASAPYVLPVCNHGRLVFNGKVLGLHGDPLPGNGRAVPPLRLHIGRFFDSQCSNEMCALRIRHRETGEEYDPRRNLLTTADGRLCTLAESILADVVGVSTLAITADDAVVLVSQSRRNVGSPLLLAPSGSGSLHPKDLNPDRTETLQDLVRRGMERELREETGIRPEEILRTTVIGFARWLERGAKPEFFGMTELTATAEEVSRRRNIRPDERLYSGGMFTMHFDIGALGHELSAGSDLLAAAGLPERIREDGSLPLLLALRKVALWRTGSAQRPT